MVAEEEITTAPVPPEVMGEPDLPQIEFPELPQIESRNPADQPSRKSNRRHKKPERFGHNIPGGKNRDNIAIFGDSGD